MKKIKLTEDTLIRIVERVIMEEEKEEANKQLMSLFNSLKNASDEEKKEINGKINNIITKNPNLTPLLGATTPTAKAAGIDK
jgi:hypothetical protein